MSLHYLLDGYNIIKQASCLADKKLEDGRLGLVQLIITDSPQGSAANAVTVFFDGNPDHYGGAPAGPVKVIFSDGESADDAIKCVIDQAKNKKKYVVVSDDKGITLYVRAQGAGVLSVRQFAAGLFKPVRGPQKNKGSKVPEAAKYVSLAKAAKINQELEKLWLQ